MQDLVTKNYNSVKFYLPHTKFEPNPIPKTLLEYKSYMKNVMQFISKRNLRIEKYCESISI